ncbi:porin family protein [Bartonella sp. 220]|uniref:outer membrane protein n=1 Tax=Bartonella sp. 220B TaxID=2967260 RepID=UPI0022A93B46|nr:outer membrane protein [Bartonella sp. 220B]MCZ2158142.1 porin family protein [Bartonella sp. 220B]
MTIKYLITTSIISLTLFSAAQAADIIVPEQSTSVIAVPAFSWTGFYIGGQLGTFSSKTTLSYVEDDDTEKWIPVKKERLPKLSGFVGGIYAGSNVDIDNGFIIGVDTDVIWSDKKSTEDISSKDVEPSQKSRSGVAGTSRSTEHTDADSMTVQYTLKQKWAGATRARVGFVIDRMMPYVAGGVVYTQLRNVLAVPLNTTDRAVSLAALLHDEKKTMIGYTLGGGVDFAMTDNVIVRAEYRYSDYGKKKFAQDKIEMSYKTNDFRVGVAYKF